VRNARWEDGAERALRLFRRRKRPWGRAARRKVDLERRNERRFSGEPGGDQIRFGVLGLEERGVKYMYCTSIVIDDFLAIPFRQLACPGELNRGIVLHILFILPLGII